MRKVKIDQLDEKFLDYKEFKDMPEVEKIIEEVKQTGDEAVKKFTFEFDHVEIDQFKIEREEIECAYSLIQKDFILNIEKAANNVKNFSKKQLEAYKDFEFEIGPGVFVGQKIVPIERVGVYVPGGRYPLVSSLIMGVIPAKIAGVKEVVVCSPPSCNGSLHPTIQVAADISGVDEIYKIGGIQAIATMAYGTRSIKRVDKIVGPGNRYVNAAKKNVYGRVGIDFVAGPTEVLIIADKDANPSFIAADLIAQAEHDVMAKPILVTDSEELATAVANEVKKQLKNLKTARVAKQSLKHNGLLLIVNSMDLAIEFANRRAPEHLELNVKNLEPFLSKLKNYGSLFIGEYSAEVLGDYSSGLNHILPTNYSSRYTGGLSVKDFIKIQTVLRVSEDGFLRIGPLAQNIAEAEGLYGHVNSVAIRMKNLGRASS